MNKPRMRLHTTITKCQHLLNLSLRTIILALLISNPFIQIHLASEYLVRDLRSCHLLPKSLHVSQGPAVSHSIWAMLILLMKVFWKSEAVRLHETHNSPTCRLSHITIRKLYINCDLTIKMCGQVANARKVRLFQITLKCATWSQCDVSVDVSSCRKRQR